MYSRIRDKQKTIQKNLYNQINYNQAYFKELDRERMKNLLFNELNVQNAKK